METVLTLEPTSSKELGGLIIFDLNLWAGGKIVESWKVNSGQPGVQVLLEYESKRSYSGDARPIPEGRYQIGQLEFKGGKFDWADSWGPGLGDFWSSITRVDNVGTLADFIRSAFGFHWDENRAWSPGSLGCVVFATKKDVERFVIAMRQYDPSYLVVDYGFGTVDEFMPTEEVDKAPMKPVKPIIKALPPKLYNNQNGASLVVRERMVLEPGTYPIGTPPGGWLMSVGERKK